MNEIVYFVKVESLKGFETLYTELLRRIKINFGDLNCLILFAIRK